MTDKAKYTNGEAIRRFYPQYWGFERYPADRCACIRKVRDQWGMLCNFADAPLEFQGVRFRNSEHLFQVMKFADPIAIQAVYASPHYKKTAKKNEFKPMRREDWGKIFIDVMRFCLQLKYEQSEAFRKVLAETGNLFIVEDQTTFPRTKPDSWGVKPDGEEYYGPNVLGRLLMELRDTGHLDYNLPEDAFDFLKHLTN